jgi:SNF2 family DNA or RNA helicase
MLKQACAGLLLDPGLGKTSISLAASSILLQKPLICGVLVIAPLRAVYDVWPTEIGKWKEFNHLTYSILHGPEKLQRLHNDEVDFYFINPEGVPWLVEQLLKLRQDQWPFDVLLVDESTKFKSAASQRFKMLRKIVGKFRRRYILTGTPTPNGLLDLFGQIYLLDLGNSLGSYISHYRNNFFYSSGFGGYTWLPREGALEEITELVSPLVLRMRAEDYLELPQLVNQYHWVDMPADAREKYKQMEEEFILEVGDDVVISPSAAAAGMRCRQIINGAIYTNPKEEEYVVIHNAKMDALKDLVEELSGQPMLLFYEFNHDRDRLVKELGWPCLGKQSQKKDSENIRLFNAGLLPGLIAHPASAGHALNLQAACCHVGWFGLTWNLEHYDQAIRRVWRQGNEFMRVICHHFCVRDSLDKRVVKVLGSKDKTQTKFLEAIRLLRS